MKSLKNLFLFALVISFISCSDDDDSNGSQTFDSTDLASLVDAVRDGTWRITQFIDDGQDETSDFDGFTFTFNADGSIDAENGTDTFTGTWSIELDDSDFDDDDDLDELEFNISFSLTNDLDELNEDWYVIDYSTNRIQLFDDDDDVDDDFLTFERVL